MIKKFKSSKGFTLIELIVVIAILAILVLLASPRFFGRTQEAVFTKHISNAKVIQNASELYFMDEDDWPRLSDEPYTSEEIEEYAESIYTLTGETIELDPEGNYYDINYNALNDYVRVDASDQAHYILQNPVGKVYYLEGLSELGKNRVDFESPGDSVEETDKIPDYYMQATDDDFDKDSNGHWRYVGSDKHVIIPHTIEGEEVTSYRNMFRETAVEGVVSDNPNATDMHGMFRGTTATTLDVSQLDTSNVTSMSAMFLNSSATTLDLSSFDTSNVTSMTQTFWNSSATTLNLSSFDTSNVTSMHGMFYGSSATSLNLSGFDTSNVTSMNQMFQNSSATTLELSSFDTSNVTWMGSMFRNSRATTLDLSSFDTSNVTNMHSMFRNSRATTLDLSSFDTSNVTNMHSMFRETSATTLDLSSFDTRNVNNRTDMFLNANARTGYARTSSDRNFFNHSDTNRPSGLSFELK